MALSNRLFSDALSDIRELQRRMSVLDQPFFNTFTSPSSGASHHMVRFPATDIVEKNDIFEVQAELPGYDKNNIKIEMPDSQTLVLSGSVVQESSSGSPKDDTDEEKQQETSHGEVVQKKEKDSQVSAKSHCHYWMNERISGSFSRTFRFPNPVKTEEIKARYENGILKITVPKVSENQPRQITIE